MFRQFIKAFEPVRNKLSRAAGGAGAGGGEGSAFQRNSVSREQQLTAALRRALPGVTYVSVQDISGGCGAMFEVSVEAREFGGLSRVQQHRLVTDSLRAEIAEMHGIRIHTAVPAPDPHSHK